MAFKRYTLLVGSIVMIFTGCMIFLLVYKQSSEAPIQGRQHSMKLPAPNFVIILLDSVRADHLSCYGYPQNTSPHIDSLAAQGITFNHAICQAPWTFPSVFSMLSGYYPHKQGTWIIKKEGTPWWQNLMKPSTTIPLLSELLQEAGYRTWAFSTNTYINDQRMKERGFEEFQYIWKAPAMEVVNYGIEKMREAENSSNPFFLYLHFMDAHHPLQPPEQYYNLFPCSDRKQNEKRHEWWEFKKHAEQEGEAFENYREHKISLYDGTIRYMDDEIGRLLVELEGSSLAHDTVVVVLADHGDEFWDHADFQALHYKSFQERQGVSHGHTLFQELIWVPLIITTFPSHKGLSSLRLQQPAIVEEAVPLVDLVPTLLSLAELLPSTQFDGTSVVALMNQSLSPAAGTTGTYRRSIFSESTASGSMKISLIEYPYKFIYAQGETNALFNIDEDQAEKENLIEEKGTVASSMAEKIFRFIEEKPPPTEELSVSEEDRKKLEALGYIE